MLALYVNLMQFRHRNPRSSYRRPLGVEIHNNLQCEWIKMDKLHWRKQAKGRFCTWNNSLIEKPVNNHMTAFWFCKATPTFPLFCRPLTGAHHTGGDQSVSNFQAIYRYIFASKIFPQIRTAYNFQQQYIRSAKYQAITGSRFPSRWSNHYFCCSNV